jgi:alkylhydroperoxidase family enzyme
MPRIEPLSPPYGDDAGPLLASLMPAGVEPILLFRTFGRNPSMTDAMRGWGSYELGRELSLSMRQRELVIDRTCARCGSEYEWGVHIALFAECAGFSREQIAATTAPADDHGVWSARERLIIRLADELHDAAFISDGLWESVAQEFSAEQILELILLAGFYHTVAYLTNGLKLPLEAYAVRFPAGAR